MKWIAAAVAVVAAAITAVVLVVVVPSSPGAGPLGEPDGFYPGGAMSGFGPVKPGQIVVMGLPLTQGNNLPIKLLGVRPLPTDNVKGLHLRYAATTGAGLQIGGTVGWHPTRWQLRSLPFVIPAFEPGGVVIGVSASAPRRYRLRGFVVDYMIGNTRYSAPQGDGLYGRFRS
ncbi:MAG TPA: hypothetical protein VGH79_10360 [Gaiellaceae bacterium]|jgi:hypothetical protein